MRSAAINFRKEGHELSLTLPIIKKVQTIYCEAE